MNVTDSSVLGQKCDTNYLKSSAAVVIYNPLSLLSSAMYMLSLSQPVAKKTLPSRYTLNISNKKHTFGISKGELYKYNKTKLLFMNFYLIRKVPVLR